jgi:hypothetical protein
MEKEYKNLVTFWREVADNSSSKSKIHKKDIIDKTFLVNDLRPSDVTKIYEIDSNPTKLHNEMIPVPYVGDILNAKIFYITLNPGYEHGDYFVNKHTNGLNDELLNNLKQESLNPEYPFFCLNPEYCHTGGYRYWDKMLKKLISKIVQNSKSKVSEIDVRNYLAKNFAVIEMTGYPSKQSDRKSLEQLTSSKLAQSFVKNALEKRENVKIMIARATEFWKVESEGSKIYKYEKGQTRGGYISDAVIDKLKLVNFIKNDMKQVKQTF